jgi:hypothetical protein
MEEIRDVTLERSGQRPLTFRGKLVWRHATSPDRAHPAYSGSPGRWRVLELYLTEGARNYVLYDQHLSNWSGERDHLEAVVFAATQTLEDVLRWLEANAPGAVASFCQRFSLAERLPEDVEIAYEETFPGGVRLRVLTDGVQSCWEVYGPDGRLLAESQPAPLLPEEIEQEARAVAAAIAGRYPLEERDG